VLGADELTYPEPQVFTVQVYAGDRVTGAEVTGAVTRPDGSQVEVTFFDDGVEGHGDELAGDGIYSAVFAAFNASGNYNLEVEVNCADGRTAESDDADPSNPQNTQTQAVPDYRREGSFAFEVTGVPNPLPLGGLTLGPGADLPDDTVEVDRLDERALSFSVTAGPQEAVELERLVIQDVDGVLEGVRRGRLWVDSGGDGEIELSGDFARPAIDVAVVNNELIFSDSVVVEAGQTVFLLLTLEIDHAQAVAQAPSPEVRLAGSPLLLGLVLLGMLWCLRRRPSLAAAVLLCGSLTISCGSDFGGGGGASGNGNAGVASLQTSLNASGIAARGLGTRAPLAVGGTGSVTGPALQIR
ncbi:MAG: choice-of-anchor X domain-containing protein, partial [Candidatus Eremiobacterota bacterium]